MREIPHECPVCKTKGKVNRKQCHGCDGKGWIVVKEYDPAPYIPPLVPYIPYVPITPPTPPWCDPWPSPWFQTTVTAGTLTITNAEGADVPVDPLPDARSVVADWLDGKDLVDQASSLRANRLSVLATRAAEEHVRLEA